MPLSPSTMTSRASAAVGDKGDTQDAVVLDIPAHPLSTGACLAGPSAGEEEPDAPTALRRGARPCRPGVGEKSALGRREAEEELFALLRADAICLVIKP